MNILVGKFVLEANANIPEMCDLENVDIRTGQECIERLQFGDVFSKKGVHLIPSIYAEAGSNGVMKKKAFEYIEQRLLDTVKDHIKEIDGIYLHLHGASEVEDIGSGDHRILRDIRRITGPYLPIAVVCDPHGNLCREYAENATIIRSYRESPHTDIERTIRFVCNALISEICDPKGIRPVYRKIPLILGGEQSVSADEPVHSINQYMDQLEQDEKILSCSWHVGYIRHDTDVAGAGIVVIPSDKKYLGYANDIADRLAAFVWDKRHEFHYTGLTADPDKAVQMVLECREKPAFLTDSGDNVTSGATGANTTVLRQFLSIGNLHKRVLFASIRDEETYNLLNQNETGSEVQIELGKNYDALSAKVSLKVTVRHKGRQEGTVLFGENGDFGGCILASVKGTPVDIIVADTNHPFAEAHQAQAAGADWNDYDVIVVKLGYAFPELLKYGKLSVMSLTDGATLQDTKKLPFKRIMRPMFPIDNI